MKRSSPRGSVVVITGASSGVGRAAAQEFAAAGAKLVLAARNAVALREVAAACERAGAEALDVPTDVTDAGAVSTLAQAALARFGRIDVWINNAGIGAVGAFDATPVEAHQQVVRTNLIGAINGAHEALRLFKVQRAGILIQTNSIGAYVPSPYAASYSASKFGLRGLSESLAGELHRWPDIHVCDLYPAFLDTPGVSHGGNYTGHALKPSPPVYDPRLVARAMVRLVERPRRRTVIGLPTTLGRIAHALAPESISRAGAILIEAYLRRAKRAAPADGNLFEPSIGHGVHGGWQKLNVRAATLGLAFGAGLLASVLLLSRASRR
ncbi:MAG: short-chain dehydrogenase [Rhodospirillales bacterium]|nr:short-chain dehydrogenase [Rhodospirillales bacterium]